MGWGTFISCISFESRLLIFNSNVNKTRQKGLSSGLNVIIIQLVWSAPMLLWQFCLLYKEHQWGPKHFVRLPWICVVVKKVLLSISLYNDTFYNNYIPYIQRRKYRTILNRTIWSIVLSVNSIQVLLVTWSNFRDIGNLRFWGGHFSKWPKLVVNLSFFFW